MDCSEFRSAYSDFTDGLLDELAEVSVHRHLSECIPCRRFHEGFQWGVSELRKQPRVLVSNDFAHRLERRLKAEASPMMPVFRRLSSATAMLLGLTVAAGGAMALMLDHQQSEPLHQTEAPGPVPVLAQRSTSHRARLGPLVTANEVASQNPLQTPAATLEAFGSHRTGYTGQLTASWTGR
jgi:predicted anti-sigma-YlaC factor YlaD